MMKKFLILAILVLIALQLPAKPVDMKTAQSSATEFLKTVASKGRLMAASPTVKWIHAERNLDANVSQSAYYVVNTDRGFAVIAGDDRARSVLAYGDAPLGGIDDMPEAVQYFLNMYKAQIGYLQAHPGLEVKKNLTAGGVSVEPMLNTAWAQGKPYSMNCPKVGRDYCKVGCSAVSLAQVMKFWEYPEKAPAMDAYKCSESGINVTALPEYTFDWSNMWDTYENVDLDRLPDVNKNAIAWLMRYVGQAEHMDYNTDKSGAEYDQIAQAIETFGYDAGAHYEMQYDYDDGHMNYTDEQWGLLMQSELRAGRPLVYCAFDMSSDSTSIMGHAFNVDGYDAQNDLYHVNFGMSSSLNAYYALNAFRIDGLTVYDFYPLMFVGLQPPTGTATPRILATPSSLNMECYAGETATTTFNVSGVNLTQSITVTVNDANGVFTASAATIAIEDAANATVTVTYAPQTAGSHSATIVLSSNGAQDVTIGLNGTATTAPLTVYAPVMAPAAEEHINLTSFRADWTDETPRENVVSYTLEVNAKSSTNLLTEADWTEQGKMSGNQASNASAYLPQGWGFSGSVFYLDGGCVSIGGEDYFLTPTFDLAGYDKVTVVVNARDYNPYYKDSQVTLSTGVDAATVTFASGYEERVATLNCGSVDRVKIEALYNVDIASIKVYAGELENAILLTAIENGDATYRLITGVTDKSYTVSDLAAAGTYLYKVKALYTDGSESAWSNVQTVTLRDNGHAFELGDVNHDGKIDVSDVTLLIASILGNSDEACPICADVNGDSKIDVSDVTALIAMILGSI